MWRGKKISVVIPTYRERKSVRASIESFEKSGFVDEIIVVDNNAETGTKEEVEKTKAKIVKESRQGYGHAIRKGLESTNADLIIVSEPDGSFDGEDVLKLLSYSNDFDMVFGSRTHLPLVHKGSDMILYKRMGDVLLGKVATLLFLCYPLTDVGCTFRLTSRSAWKKIASECQSRDGIFATEWLMVAAKNNVRFIEIPINYRSRIGKSLFVSKPYTKGTIWGVRKLYCILKIWAYGIMDKKLYS